jgi:hypothetical protein
VLARERRKKLTKLAGNKDVRRSLNKEIKGVVEVR